MWSAHPNLCDYSSEFSTVKCKSVNPLQNLLESYRSNQNILRNSSFIMRRQKAHTAFLFLVSGGDWVERRKLILPANPRIRSVVAFPLPTQLPRGLGLWELKQQRVVFCTWHYDQKERARTQNCWIVTFKTITLGYVLQRWEGFKGLILKGKPFYFWVFGAQLHFQ